MNMKKKSKFIICTLCIIYSFIEFIYMFASIGKGSGPNPILHSIAMCCLAFVVIKCFLPAIVPSHKPKYVKYDIGEIDDTYDPINCFGQIAGMSRMQPLLVTFYTNGIVINQMFLEPIKLKYIGMYYIKIEKNPYGERIEIHHNLSQVSSPIFINETRNSLIYKILVERCP